MENKKATNGQLIKKIKNALVFVPKDRDYKTVFFEDKMVRLEVTKDYCVISTGYHQHVFNAINPNQGGYARPFLYTQKVCDIVCENDCKTSDGVYTFEHLLDVLSKKDDKTEYNIVTYYGWWLFNIFQPLYQVGENEIETFLTYEDYLHKIARSAIVMGEKQEDMSNLQFVNAILEKEKSFIEGIEERTLFFKQTDEMTKAQTIKAIQETQDEETLTQKIIENAGN